MLSYGDTPLCGSPTSAAAGASTPTIWATGWIPSGGLAFREGSHRRTPQDDALEDAADTQTKQKVIPYVEDTRNILVVRLRRAGFQADRHQPALCAGTRHRSRVPARRLRTVQRGAPR